LFGDSELLRHRSLFKRAVKTPLVRWFFNQCDVFFTIGDNNEAYYRQYGVPQQKLLRGACPVDMQRFTIPPEQQAADRSAVRGQLGIPESAMIVVFSGKFQDYKRPTDLLEALGLLAKPTKELVHLLYIGDGPERLTMERRVDELLVGDQVHITGFVNQKDMPRLLAAGDVLAVTSERDAHPLTVTEALPFGMPIIASDRVGCVGPTDTARPGQNTLVYRCGDTEELANQISMLVNDKKLRAAMGGVSEAIAPTQDIGIAADGVIQAWQLLQSVGQE
jgi:glycosyltransferase involved in cell wall biosynthesis